MYYLCHIYSTYYFERFMKNEFAQHMFFDFEGYTSWTVEQRFHHFNVHRLMKEKMQVDLFKGEHYAKYSRYVE